MNIVNKIKSIDGTKWLKYGFKFITRINEDDPETIVAYLKSILNYSDDDIMNLVFTHYTINKNGSVVCIG